MINLTPVASTKVKEIMSMQSPVPVALRVAVVGGGCSGFQYHMAFENQTSDADQVFEFDGLKVAVDQMSSMYLDGIEIDTLRRLKARDLSSIIPTSRAPAAAAAPSASNSMQGSASRACAKPFFGLLSDPFRSLFYAP